MITIEHKNSACQSLVVSGRSITSFSCTLRLFFNAVHRQPVAMPVSLTGFITVNLDLRRSRFPRMPRPW